MNRFFTFQSVLAVVAVAGVVQGTASAACWYPDEIVADQVKDFQYMLMVGALQCRNSSGVVDDGYNAFVAQQHNVLDSKSYVLKGHFLRENGVTGGRAAYDQAATAMSNRHAGRMDDPSFCATIAVYTRMAATASDRDFVTLAEAVIEAPASSCAAAPFAAPVSLPPLARRAEPLPPLARRAEPLPPLARRAEPLPLVEAATAAVQMAAADDPYAGEIVAEPRAERAVFTVPAEPVPLPAESAPAAVVPAAVVPAVAVPAAAVPAAVVPPVTAAVAYASPPALRVAAAIPVTAIADAPVVPPVTAPSPAAALQAAIVALQAAADALKASGPTS